MLGLRAQETDRNRIAAARPTCPQISEEMACLETWQPPKSPEEMWIGETRAIFWESKGRPFWDIAIFFETFFLAKITSAYHSSLECQGLSLFQRIFHVVSWMWVRIMYLKMTGSNFDPILTHSHLFNFCRALRMQMPQTILVSFRSARASCMAWSKFPERLAAMICRMCTSFIFTRFQYINLLVGWICFCLSKWFLILARIEFARMLTCPARRRKTFSSKSIECIPKSGTILCWREGTKGQRDIVVRAGCKKARSQHLLHYIRFNMRLSRKWVFLLPLFKETWQSRCRRKRQTNPTREAIRRLSLHKVSNLFVIYLLLYVYIYNIIIFKVSNVDVAMTSVQHVRHASCLVELRKQCAAGEVQGDEVLCVVLLVKYPMISNYIPRYILLYPIIFPQCPHYCWLHTFIAHLQSAWITIIIKLFKHV